MKNKTKTAGSKNIEKLMPTMKISQKLDTLPPNPKIKNRLPIKKKNKANPNRSKRKIISATKYLIKVFIILLHTFFQYKS
jgi:hypothetical protein